MTEKRFWRRCCSVQTAALLIVRVEGERTTAPPPTAEAVGEGSTTRQPATPTGTGPWVLKSSTDWPLLVREGLRKSTKCSPRDTSKKTRAAAFPSMVRWWSSSSCVSLFFPCAICIAAAAFDSSVRTLQQTLLFMWNSLVFHKFLFCKHTLSLLQSINFVYLKAFLIYGVILYLYIGVLII